MAPGCFYRSHQSFFFPSPWGNNFLTGVVPLVKKFGGCKWLHKFIGFSYLFQVFQQVFIYNIPPCHIVAKFSGMAGVFLWISALVKELRL